MSLSVERIASIIDHTLLSPTLTRAQLESALEEAARYPFAAVVVPPCYVRDALSLLNGKVRVGTVSGFPLGFQEMEVKRGEIERAIEDGAQEVDMVMNLCAFKSGEYGYVRDEIEEMVRIISGRTLKVIIETAYLEEDEKVLACNLVAEGGATFVKTSTGFGPGGATPEDVRLLKGVSKGRVKVKASGGIRDLSTLLSMVEAGADRVGTSSGLSIIREVEREVAG